MLKKALLAVVLLPLFFSSNFVIAASKEDLAKKFSEAQRLSSQGNIAQAISAYQALILENPLLPEAYNNLAALYLKQNNTKQAKYVLEQGLHAHNGYGVLYESLTAINIAMAKEAYSKALQIDLKPANIEIASLSLKDNKEQIKNTIVISPFWGKPLWADPEIIKRWKKRKFSKNKRQKISSQIIQKQK